MIKNFLLKFNPILRNSHKFLFNMSWRIEEHKIEAGLNTQEQRLKNNLEKLKKVREVQKLSIEYCQNSLQDTSENRIHFYLVQGSFVRKRTQNSNLLQKLELFNTEEEEKQKRRKEKLLNLRQDNEFEEETRPAQEYEIYRYFKQDILCFRCKQPGHFRTVCPELKTCLFCLSKTHQMKNCQQNICFNCYELGHMNSKCKKSRERRKCEKCQRFHSNQCYFMAKAKSMKIINCQDIEQTQVISCLYCLKIGHSNCSKDLQCTYLS